MQNLLDRAIDFAKPLIARGVVADYIPELAHADGRLLGIAAACDNGAIFEAGDSRAKFTMQSVSKVLILTAALLECGEASVFTHVSLEPTADAFNSIVNLEMKNQHRPLNPFINSGAILLTTLLKGDTSVKRFSRVLDLARAMSNDADLTINESVYLSEKATGARNRALAYYMASTGVIEGDVEDILDCYFRICSIEVDCVILAKMAYAIAQNGIVHETGERLFDERTGKIVKTIMSLCGMYDESGEFALRAGIPSKSGVGGGIMSAVPGRFGLATFGPALNEKGSSIGGLEALSFVSREMDLGIY